MDALAGTVSGRRREPMNNLKNVNDLIRIGDAIAVLCRKTCHPGPFCPDAYCDEMWDKFDGVERIAPERKTGRWIHADVEPDDNDHYPRGWMPWYCSECGIGVGKHQTTYCPNCGAEMEVTV